MQTDAPQAYFRSFLRQCPKVALAVLPFASALLGLSVLAAAQDQGNEILPGLSAQQVVEHIDAAVHDRASAVSGYTVHELYSLYRNNEDKPSAQETVQTVYSRAAGKTYTPISQTGSSVLRGAVIDKVLAGEKELNLPANREHSWTTSDNYDMQPQPGTVELNGRTCILVALKPKHKSQHLFNGKMWVDASDFTVVRLAGTPSESPSFFAGETTVTRDYDKIDGFSMATHAEAHSKSFLFGESLLKIDYTGYKIDRAASSSAAQSASPSAATPSSK